MKTQTAMSFENAEFHDCSLNGKRSWPPYPPSLESRIMRHSHAGMYQRSCLSCNRPSHLADRENAKSCRASSSRPMPCGAYAFSVVAVSALSARAVMACRRRVVILHQSPAAKARWRDLVLTLSRNKGSSGRPRNTYPRTDHREIQ